MRLVYGYEYDRTASGLVVMPRRLQSKTFHIDYLNLRRAGESQTQICSGEISRTTPSPPTT